MAFFGLTALGPQNSFNAALRDGFTLQCFSDGDVDKAFQAADKDGSGFVAGTELTAVLSALYRGDPPERDLELFMAKYDANKDGRLSKAEFVEGMRELRKEVEEREAAGKWSCGSGSEFNSNMEYRDHIRRHAAVKRGPRDRYSVPLTAQQELGWHRPPEDDMKNPVLFGKKSCPETVYASELVKSGVYY